MRGRMVFEETSYSTECAVQSSFNAMSFGSDRHFLEGREMFEGPKSVRSKITTRSLGRSCMCMAEMPMVWWRRDQWPGAAGHGGRWWRRRRVRRSVMGLIMCRWEVVVVDLCGGWKL
ncbi:hypothetical protein HanIR_Chr05g0242251 [Helianthus annuus]|nr:hypothetical protein HanIR_Chr05g0242251 [Helianthus annuus]